MKLITKKTTRVTGGKLLQAIAWPFLLLMVSATYCKAETGGEIPRIKKEVKLKGEFRHITINGDISVVLTNGPAGSIAIEGIEKTVDRIRYVLQHDTLSIDVNQFIGRKQLTLYLSAIALQNMQLNGDSDLASNEILQPGELRVMLNGSIKVRIKTSGKISFDSPENIELVKHTRNIVRQAF